MSEINNNLIKVPNSQCNTHVHISRPDNPNQQNLLRLDESKSLQMKVVMIHNCCVEMLGLKFRMNY